MEAVRHRLNPVAVSCPWQVENLPNGSIPSSVEAITIRPKEIPKAWPIETCCIYRYSGFSLWLLDWQSRTLDQGYWSFQQTFLSSCFIVLEYSKLFPRCFTDVTQGRGSPLRLIGATFNLSCCFLRTLSILSLTFLDLGLCWMSNSWEKQILGKC